VPNPAAAAGSSCPPTSGVLLSPGSSGCKARVVAFSVTSDRKMHWSFRQLSSSTAANDGPSARTSVVQSCHQQAHGEQWVDAGCSRGSESQQLQRGTELCNETQKYDTLHCSTWTATKLSYWSEKICCSSICEAILKPGLWIIQLL